MPKKNAEKCITRAPTPSGPPRSRGGYWSAGIRSARNIIGMLGPPVEGPIFHGKGKHGQANDLSVWYPKPISFDGGNRIKVAPPHRVNLLSG